MDKKFSGETMHRDRQLLDAIIKVQTVFVEESDPRKIFEVFLNGCLSLTGSEYGFIGEVLHSQDKQPYLKTFASTNIVWNEETLNFYRGKNTSTLEFYNLKTLFGHALLHKEVVIANEPMTDPRHGGIPKEHPPLNAFLGLPILSRGEMVGMAGLANKAGGYTQKDVDQLQPLLLTCGNYIRLLWDEREKKVAQAALKASEIRSQAILDSSLDSIITISEDGYIVSANKVLVKMFGYQEAEVIGQKINMLMPEPHRSHHDDYLNRYITTGEARIIGIGRETQAMRKDGTRFPIELAVTEFFAKGKRHFTGFIKDISIRKKALVDLEESRRQLSETNENMITILNQSRAAVLMVDAKGRIEFVNQALERFFETSKENIIKKYWEKGLPLSSLQKQKIRDYFKEQRDSETTITVPFTLDNGKKVWGDIEIYDDPRSAQGKIIFIYDVTEINILRSKLGENVTARMVGNSPRMLELINKLESIASGDWTVLVQGETGVGKELVANAIHAMSPRKNGPFIAVNCGGLTETLLTSQLFGYRRGAFTGAAVDHEGFFEAANGGTLFLDEIGDVPMNVQTAMLRVLEEREVTRVGETKPRKINVRVVAATNRDLAEEVRAGRFRQDLLYRIQIARAQVPPLRERKADIPLLAQFFLLKAKAQTQKAIEMLEDAAMQALISYEWPGNVRELRNVIDVAVINCHGKTIRVSDLPPELTSLKPQKTFEIAEADDLENEIGAALKKARGNRTKAAKLMGVSRATFYRRLIEAGLETRKKK